MKTKSLSQPHKENSSRKRILEVAVPLFASKGYGNTGLREIAKAADVNLAMINYFFGSKKALLKEILDIFFSGYLEVARRELAGDDLFEVKIKRFIHKAITYFASCPDYLLVTISELYHDDPEILEHKAQWGRQMMEIMGEQLSSNTSSPVSGAVPPVIFCSLLTSMMASRFLFTPLMQQVQPGIIEESSMTQYAETISLLFLYGYNGQQ
jgi:AcrR family transcriptional regulator